MLLMLYKAVSMAQLAYMDGMDPETGEIHPLLVGLEGTQDGKFNVYPLARLFNKLDAIPAYLTPDGEGNYVDFTIPTTLLGDIPAAEEAGPGPSEEV